ncbi:MAG TPA: DNA alkylation repair protein [Candidatus Acidoferrales bacterium]|nr:DNA alkylation repair protein [Candidatus Acidoferrales bacterium]
MKRRSSPPEKSAATGARRGRTPPPQDQESARERCVEILARMGAIGSPRDAQKLSYWGIVAARSYGLSAPQMHALAREAGRDHALALELWATGVHDARHVAALTADPALCTEELLEAWAREFSSWDIVDGCCCYLFIYTRYGWKKTAEWSRRPEEFVKRAAFSLMAYLAVHDKAAPDGKFLRLLPIIEREAHDERNFVRKAVNWALRQIGKRNLRLHRSAIAAGERIRRQGTRPARWIAADALRELGSSAVQIRLREKAKPRRKRATGAGSR